jgi:hypothetical protein
MIPEAIGKGFAEGLDTGQFFELHHELALFAHEEMTFDFDDLRHLHRLHCPPATGAHEELPALQTSGRDEVDRAEPGRPADLGRSLQHRAHGIVVDPAAAEKAKSYHFWVSFRSASISSSRFKTDFVWTPSRFISVLKQ